MSQLLLPEWNFLKAAVPELTDYLLSATLFWPLSQTRAYGRSPRERTLIGDLSRLTLGNFLLASFRIRAGGEAIPPPAELQTLQDQVCQIKKRWPGHWLKKVNQEIPARLQMWQDDLLELISDTGERRSQFRHAVRLRVILELLLAEVNSTAIGEYPWPKALAFSRAASTLEFAPDRENKSGTFQRQEQPALAALDELLRQHSHLAPFIWEPELAGGFPPQVFWFLYLEL